MTALARALRTPSESAQSSGNAQRALFAGLFSLGFGLMLLNLLTPGLRCPLHHGRHGK